MADRMADLRDRVKTWKTETGRRAEANHHPLPITWAGCLPESKIGQRRRRHRG